MEDTLFIERRKFPKKSSLVIIRHTLGVTVGSRRIKHTMIRFVHNYGNRIESWIEFIYRRQAAQELHHSVSIRM